jgi:hypothetical protein
MGHTINDDEIRQVTKLIAQLEQHEKNEMKPLDRLLPSGIDAAPIETVS